jgi:3-oxoacyl-[acyl-carrier-protein] synthase II
MSDRKRRIVITGFGAVSPIGLDHETIWQNLVAGRSGVDAMKAFEPPADFPPFAAEVMGFDGRKFVPKENRKVTKVMARDIQLGVAAAKLALDHCKVLGAVHPDRIGVNCGAGLIATEHSEISEAIHLSLDSRGQFDLKRWGSEGIKRLYPLWMLKYLPNMPACHISILNDAQGPNNSITCGEASALQAIGEAMRVMQRGAADAFLAGGTDTKIHPLSLVRLKLLDRLSHRRTDPQSASRPFDAQRDGTIPGEGSGFVALETAEFAEKRGTQPIAELAGFGASWNKDRGRGAAQAIQSAVADAGLTINDLGFLVAHGTGCVTEDRSEQRGLAELLGARRTPVLALKGYWGFQGAASGMLEIVACLLAQKHGQLPASINLVRQDSDAPPLHFVTESISFIHRPFAVCAIGYGGQCAAVVIHPLSA